MPNLDYFLNHQLRGYICTLQGLVELLPVSGVATSLAAALSQLEASTNAVIKKQSCEGRWLSPQEIETTLAVLLAEANRINDGLSAMQDLSNRLAGMPGFDNWRTARLEQLRRVYDAMRAVSSQRAA